MEDIDYYVREDFIENREDVIENIKTLYGYLAGVESEEYKEWAISRMSRGSNYIVEVIDGKICFAPSRFVGYKENTKEKHEEGGVDGRLTDNQIRKYYQKIIDEPRLDEILNQELEKYGKSVGSKKYWIPKGITVEDILAHVDRKEKHYWIGRVIEDYWDQAIENSYWLAQQRYGIQTNSAVTNILKCISEVKIGDVILLTCEGIIYAYGNVVRCPFKTDQISNLKDIINRNENDYTEDIVKYDDSDAFYEDLTDGVDSWGQRIMVDSWHYYTTPSNVTTYGVQNEITQGVSTMTFLGISESFAKEKIEELKKQYKDNNMYISEIMELLEQKRNIILQGAPGTGKTYNTAAIALSILGITDVNLNDHKAVMERYNQLQGKQIFFTTFHQSMDYEDFVEGLRPEILRDDKGNNIGVTYEPTDGIFKIACKAVKEDESKDIVDCIDEYLQTIKGIQNKKIIPSISGKVMLNVWWDGNSTISIKSEYSTSDSIASLNIEKVKLQALGEGIENNHFQYTAAFINAVKKEYAKSENRPVVLIIDEINRGNVSKIFGELITLLEADKRETNKNDLDDNKHTIRVTLPYSHELFSVPDNLYIIGTMNTTDRSTGTLDYALRRRFAFVTIKSKVSVVEKYYDKLGNEDLKRIAVGLFYNISQFIGNPKHLCGDMSIDDLMVGHSYFMASSRGELLNKIKYEVIPLINEYINDGILNVNQKEKNDAFRAWSDLLPYSPIQSNVESSEEV